MANDKLIIALIAGFFTLAGSIIVAIIAYNRTKLHKFSDKFCSTR